jgi:nucleoside-diphosphate-sugar epimerase
LNSRFNDVSRIDAIINVSQSRLSGRPIYDAARTLEVNTTLPLDLLRKCQELEIPRFIHFSSGGVYHRGQEVVSETSPYERLENLNLYLQSKLITDFQLVELCPHEVSMTLVRPFFVYGPGASADRLIGRLAEKVSRGQPVQVSSTDGIVVNPCHVDDVVDGTCALLEDEQTAVVNMAGSDVLSLGHLVRNIAAHLGQVAQLEIATGEDQDCVADITLFSDLLKRQPRGIKDLSFLSID